MESYLTSAPNTVKYINNVLTSFWELNKIPEEFISESHALFLFLRDIKDPDFDRIVEIIKNKDDDDLIQSVVYISKQERGQKREGPQIDNSEIKWGIFVKRIISIYKKIVPLK